MRAAKEGSLMAAINKKNGSVVAANKAAPKRNRRAGRVRNSISKQRREALLRSLNRSLWETLVTRVQETLSNRLTVVRWEDSRVFFVRRERLSAWSGRLPYGMHVPSSNLVIWNGSLYTLVHELAHALCVERGDEINMMMDEVIAEATAYCFFGRSIEESISVAKELWEEVYPTLKKLRTEDMPYIRRMIRENMEVLAP